MYLFYIRHFYHSNIQKLKKQWELVRKLRLVASGFQYDDNKGVVVDNKNMVIWDEFCKVRVFHSNFHLLMFTTSRIREHTSLPTLHFLTGSRWNR